MANPRWNTLDLFGKALGNAGTAVADYVTARNQQEMEARQRQSVYDLLKGSSMSPVAGQAKVGGTLDRPEIPTQLNYLDETGKGFEQERFPGAKDFLTKAKFLGTMGLAPMEYLKTAMQFMPQSQVVGGAKTGYQQVRTDPFTQEIVGQKQIMPPEQQGPNMSEADMIGMMVQNLPPEQRAQAAYNLRLKLAGQKAEQTADINTEATIKRQGVVDTQRENRDFNQERQDAGAAIVAADKVLYGDRKSMSDPPAPGSLVAQLREAAKGWASPEDALKFDATYREIWKKVNEQKKKKAEAEGKLQQATQQLEKRGFKF